jgi:hypothetical protein
MLGARISEPEKEPLLGNCCVSMQKNTRINTLPQMENPMEAVFSARIGPGLCTEDQRPLREIPVWRQVRIPPS